MEPVIEMESLTELPIERRNHLVELSNNIEHLEAKLKEYKKLEQDYKDFKEIFHDKMEEFGVKKFVSIEGTKFTRVLATEDKIKMSIVFDEDSFKKDNPDMYKKYTIQKEDMVKGKKGYLRITLPEDVEKGE